jgi:hypothetical protein
MEKKQYIEPSMIVRAVAPCLLQGMSDTPGSGEDLSKEIVLPEDNGNEDVATHDVWED